MTLFVLILFQYGFALQVLFFGHVPHHICLTFLILFSSLPGGTLLHTFSLEVRFPYVLKHVALK